MASEAGHHSSRVYIGQDGALYLNGASVYNGDGNDISAQLDVLDTTVAAELAYIDGVTAGTAAVSKAVVLDGSGDVVWVDGGTIDTGSTTGVTIGAAVTDKIGFWATTPVVQPASADQADQGAMTTVGANTGTAGAGLSLIGNTTLVDQSTNIMNDFVALQEDIAALDTLVTAMRTALVNTGIIKGAA